MRPGHGPGTPSAQKAGAESLNENCGLFYQPLEMFKHPLPERACPTVVLEAAVILHEYSQLALLSAISETAVRGAILAPPFTMGREEPVHLT